MKGGKDNLDLSSGAINPSGLNFDILSDRGGNMNESFRHHQPKALASKQMPKCFHLKKNSIVKGSERNTSVMVV
jgi:hypothetical protein